MFPENIIVVARGQFQPGVAVRITFGMAEKNDFDYITFLDATGRAEISREQLLRSFDQERQFFLMDFADPRTAFNGDIQAELLTKEDVETAIEAYGKFSSHYDYPHGYLDGLKLALTANPQSRCTIHVRWVGDTSA